MVSAPAQTANRLFTRLYRCAVGLSWFVVAYRLLNLMTGGLVARIPAMWVFRAFGLGFYVAFYILLRHLHFVLMALIAGFVVSLIYRRALRKRGRAGRILSLLNWIFGLVRRLLGYAFLFAVAMISVAALSMALLRFGCLLYGAAVLFLGFDAWRGKRISVESLRSGKLVPLVVVWVAWAAESVIRLGPRQWAPTTIYACLGALFIGAAVVILRRALPFKFSPASAAAATLASFLFFNLFNVWVHTSCVQSEAAYRAVGCDLVRGEPYLKPLTPQQSYYAAEYFGAARKLFITKMECRCVYAMSPDAKGHMRKIALPGIPNYMAGDPAGNRLYVLLGDAMEPKSIDMVGIDAARERIVSRLKLPSTLYSIAYSKALRRIYVATLNSPRFFEIDARMLRVRRRIRLPWTASYIYAMRADDKAGRIYATDFVMLGNLFVIDQRTLRPVKVIPLHTPLSGVDISERLNRVYAGEFFGKAIDVFDRRTLRRIGSFPTGFTLRGLAVDDKRGLLYATTMSDRFLWIHDLRTGRLLKAVPIGVNARSIFVGEEGRVFIASGCGAFEVDVDKALGGTPKAR